jgi:hypothetical protein
MRTAVDLPAPFGPSRPNTVPSSTANDRPSRARTSPGYSFRRPSASIALLAIAVLLAYAFEVQNIRSSNLLNVK